MCSLTVVADRPCGARLAAFALAKACIPFWGKPQTQLRRTDHSAVKLCMTGCCRSILVRMDHHTASAWCCQLISDAPGMASLTAWSTSAITAPPRKSKACRSVCAVSVCCSRPLHCSCTLAATLLSTCRGAGQLRWVCGLFAFWVKLCVGLHRTAGQQGSEPRQSSIYKVVLIWGTAKRCSSDCAPHKGSRQARHATLYSRVHAHAHDIPNWQPAPCSTRVYSQYRLC